MVMVSGCAELASFTMKTFCARVMVEAVTATIMSGTSGEVELPDELAISISCPTV